MINASADEDTTIDAVQRKTARWKQVATDLAQAQGADSDQFSKAKKRCRDKFSEVPKSAATTSSSTTKDSAAPQGLCFRIPSRIPGSVRASLRAALMAAIPTREQLSQVLLEQLGVRLSDITSNSTHDHVVSELMNSWAIPRDRLDDLVQAAFQFNPHCPELRTFVTAYLVS
ncbi:MAG: hypothetical protein K2X93_26395 [Candidatus Obscuribacterales bacterium]|nr:hypothetical protein [Candidatus Obscuribacterales bacterium]